MSDEQDLAVFLAELVGLMKGGSADAVAQEAAVRSLAGLTGRRSWTIGLEGDRMAVEGVAVLPGKLLPDLISQLRMHGVAEIQFAYRTSAADIRHLAETLALHGAGLEQAQDRLRAAQVRRIWVLGPERDETPTSVKPEADTADAEPATPALRPMEKSEYSELMQSTRAGKISLSAAVKRMRNMIGGPQLSQGLNVVAEGVFDAVRSNRVEGALDAVAITIRQEAEATQHDVQLCYGVVVRRMLNPDVVRPFAKLLLDPLYSEDVMVVIRRAGANATQVLLDLLVAAPTFAERRAFLAALRKIEEGTDNIVRMLDHHEWYVVRNVADLIGELGLEDAVPGLGRVVEHQDVRVRRSVAIALTRIGSPATIRHVRTALRDPDPEIRMTVAKGIGGAGLGALVMPIVNQADSEEEETIRAELYRAMGRIGTPDAVQALDKVSRKSGKLFGPRLSESRRAAVEGLTLAGGAAAATALESLSKDRDRAVRDAARQGLQDLSSSSERM